MMKTLTSMRFAATVFLVSSAAAAAPSRDAVERLLAGYEPRTTAADFQRLGAGVDHVLVAIAVDQKTSPTRRQRALAALGVVPSTEGHDLLRAVIRDRVRATEGADLLDLHACVRGLAGFGVASAGDLVPLLVHPSSDIRQAAVESLAAAGVVDAAPSLRLRLTVERDDDVVRAIRRALAALEPAR